MSEFTKISFSNKLNPSLQVGDFIYVANILDGGRTSAPELAAKVLKIEAENFWIDRGNTTEPIIAAGSSFILFAKDIQANESCLKGYYADITFENSSNKKTELFAISSEVVLSSK